MTQRPLMMSLQLLHSLGHPGEGKTLQACTGSLFMLMTYQCKAIPEQEGSVPILLKGLSDAS